jgi:hypothetical protein
LLLVMGDHPVDPSLVPSFREFALFHLRFLCRLRYAKSGLPRDSYAVITNMLFRSRSGT